MEFLRDSEGLTLGLTKYFLSGMSLKGNMIFYLCFKMNETNSRKHISFMVKDLQKIHQSLFHVLIIPLYVFLLEKKFHTISHNLILWYCLVQQQYPVILIQIPL